MCGIAGVVLSEANSSSGPEDLKTLAAAIKHRGPDATGFWSSENQRVHFAHVRLSILDLTAGANQPLKSFDKRFSIVFNGEIYNYKQLRAECELKGSRFQTSGDTEVILEMYRHLGVQCFKKFRGMWALAIYDTAKNEIVLSRDPFGIKPLYYNLENGSLFFASEPMALSRVVSKGKEIDEVTKELFLDHGVVDRGQWTFFKHIKKFPQSSYSVISLDQKLDQLSTETYWDFNDYPTYNFKSQKEWSEEFSSKLKESIELHTASDVEIGATLSGGLDSSSIVSYLKEGQHKFRTFSSDYSAIDARIDETFYVDSVCRFLEIPNHKTNIHIQDFVQNFSNAIRAQGEPFPTCSILSQYFVYELIGKNKVKVVLGGQGADESLGGYSFLQKLLINELKDTNRLAYLYEALLYAAIHKQRPSITNTYFSKNSEQKTSVKDFINFKSDGTLQDRLSSLDFKPQSYNDYLKFLVLESNLPQILRYEDRNSMYFSIESRVPFLDPELVNVCLQIPVSYRYKNGYSKYLLRKALEGKVPTEVSKRRAKLGFPGPDYQVYKEITGKDLDYPGSKMWRQMTFDYWEKSL